MQMFNRKDAFLFMVTGHIVGKKQNDVISDMDTEVDKLVKADNYYHMDNIGRIFDRFSDEVDLDELPCEKIYYLKK